MVLSLRADSDPGGANFYILVPSLGLPKPTARVGSSFLTAEKKAVRRDGVRSLIVYSSKSTLYLKKAAASETGLPLKSVDVSHIIMLLIQASQLIVFQTISSAMVTSITL